MATMKPQGVLFGYRWFLDKDSYVQSMFRQMQGRRFAVTSVPIYAPVYAVNEGSLRYDKNTNVVTLTRQSPVVGYEHWEYQGLRLALPLFEGKFRRVKAGDLLGHVKQQSPGMNTGYFEIGLHHSTFPNPLGAKTYSDPMEKLRYYGASFYTAPELGEVRPLLFGGILLFLLYKVLK